MTKMSKLFRSTRSRIIGATVGASLVAALAVGVTPYATNDALGQTPPPQDFVDVDFDFNEDTNCLTLSIAIRVPGLPANTQSFTICLPTFSFGGA